MQHRKDKYLKYFNLDENLINNLLPLKSLKL